MKRTRRKRKRMMILVLRMVMVKIVMRVVLKERITMMMAMLRYAGSLRSFQ